MDSAREERPAGALGVAAPDHRLGLLAEPLADEEAALVRPGFVGVLVDDRHARRRRRIGQRRRVRARRGELGGGGHGEIHRRRELLLGCRQARQKEAYCKRATE